MMLHQRTHEEEGSVREYNLPRQHPVLQLSSPPELIVGHQEPEGEGSQLYITFQQPLPRYLPLLDVELLQLQSLHRLVFLEEESQLSIEEKVLRLNHPHDIPLH